MLVWRNLALSFLSCFINAKIITLQSSKNELHAHYLWAQSSQIMKCCYTMSLMVLFFIYIQNFEYWWFKVSDLLQSKPNKIYMWHLLLVNVVQQGVPGLSIQGPRWELSISPPPLRLFIHLFGYQFINIIFSYGLRLHLPHLASSGTELWCTPHIYDVKVE